MCFSQFTHSNVNLIQNTLARIPRMMFDQTSRHPIPQSSWCTLLTITQSFTEFCWNIISDRMSLLLLLLSRFSRVRLCDPIDSSPPGSPVPGILQARTLEWVAISFSNSWKWKVKVKSLSPAQLLATPWTAAHPYKITTICCLWFLYSFSF